MENADSACGNQFDQNMETLHSPIGGDITFDSKKGSINTLAKRFLDRWRYKKVPPFHFTDDISIRCSMEKYPHEVAIVKRKKCNHCGGTLVRLFLDPYASDVVYCREPDAGYLIICTKCKEWDSLEKAPPPSSKIIE